MVGRVTTVVAETISIHAFIVKDAMEAVCVDVDFVNSILILLPTDPPRSTLTLLFTGLDSVVLTSASDLSNNVTLTPDTLVVSKVKMETAAA